MWRVFLFQAFKLSYHILASLGLPLRAPRRGYLTPGFQQRSQPDQGGQKVAVGSTEASWSQEGSLTGSDFWKRVFEESKVADIDSLPYEQRLDLERRLRHVVATARQDGMTGHSDEFGYLG